MSWISTESFETEEDHTLRPESCSSTSTNWSSNRLPADHLNSTGAGGQVWPYNNPNFNKYATISSSSSFHQSFAQQFRKQKRSKSPPHNISSQQQLQLGQGNHHQYLQQGQGDTKNVGRRKSSTAFDQVFSYFKSLEKDPPPTSSPSALTNNSYSYNSSYFDSATQTPNSMSGGGGGGMHSSWTSTSGFESMASSSNPRYSSHEDDLTPTPGSNRSHRSSSLGHALSQQQQQHLYQQPEILRSKSGHSDRNSYPGHTQKPVPPPKPAPPVKPPRRSLVSMDVFGDGSNTGSGGRSRSFHPSHQHSLKNVNPNMSKSQHQLNSWYSRTIDWVEGINDATFGGFEDGPYSLPAPPEGYGNVTSATAMKRSASNDAVEDFDHRINDYNHHQNYWNNENRNNSGQRKYDNRSGAEANPVVDVSNLYAEVIKPKRNVSSFSGKENVEQKRNHVSSDPSSAPTFLPPNIPSASSAFSTFRGQHHQPSNEIVADNDPYPRLNRLVSSHVNNSSQGQFVEPVYSQIKKKENPYESVRPGQRSSGIYDEVGPGRLAPQPPTVPMHQSQARSSHGYGSSGAPGHNVQRSSSSSKIPNTVPNVSNQQQQNILQPSQVLEQLQHFQSSGHRRSSKPSESSHTRSKSEHHPRCPSYAHTHDVTTGEIINTNVTSSANVRSPLTSSFSSSPGNVHHSSSSTASAAHVTSNPLSNPANGASNSSHHSNNTSFVESSPWANGHPSKQPSAIPRRMSATDSTIPSSITSGAPSLVDKRIGAADGNQSVTGPSSSQHRVQKQQQQYNNNRQLLDQHQQLNQQQLGSSSASSRRCEDQNGGSEAVYARIPPPPPPDVALKRIRTVIKPLFQEYKNEKKMRPRDVETITEEKYFSCMEAKSGKKVIISTRKIGNRISRQLFPDASMLTDPVPDDFWAEKENHTSTGQRPSKGQNSNSSEIVDGKKSLRRNKNHSSNHFGTAERKKKHKLSTLPRNHKTSEHNLSNHSKGSSEEKERGPTVIVVENIDIENGAHNLARSMTEKSELRVDGKSPSGRSQGRSPIERSLSCDLRPPNISPFDCQKEWTAIESIMASFATQTSTTTTTSSEVESEIEPSKVPMKVSNADGCVKNSQNNSQEPKTSETKRNKPEVPKRPSLAPKPKITSRLSPSMSLDSHRPSGSRNFMDIRGGSRSPCFDTSMSVFEWAKTIGLSESMAQILIENGFDDLKFMGPNVLELNDLAELNINNTNDQSVILENCKNLPLVPKLSSKEDDQKCLSIKSWLNSLNLAQYEDRFVENGFIDMEKVRKIWEVELNCVLDINKLGHRKRILASLGETISLINDLGLEDLDLDRMSIGLGLLSAKN